MQLLVRKIFKEKNPKLAAVIPGFIFRLIEKIIHQDEMNNFLKIHGEKKGIDFLNATINLFNVKIIVKGEENLPENGRAIFVSNHPLGGLDGIILIKVLADRYGSVKALVNDILMSIENLEEYFLPINKHGANTRKNAEIIEAAYQSDIPIFSFPAGLCSRENKNKICDSEWKKSFITKSVSTKRNVVPIFTLGRNSNRFYKIAKFRKFIGLKTNIEMFLLADEMFKQRNKTITVTIGKSIEYSLFDHSKTPNQWSEYVKERVYEME